MSLSDHTFILKKDGTVYSTGDNQYGQLGLGNTTNRSTFTKVNIDNVEKISCGRSHTFILKKDGTLYSAGNNQYGQLGLGNTTNRNTFTKVNLDNVKDVICGINHTFIIKKDGTVYSTGRNDYGQLGLGDTTNKTTFTKVNIDNVEKISCGYFYTFILKKDGTVYSAGSNQYGQLGLGDTTDRKTFTKVNIDDVKSTNDMIMIQSVIFLIKSLSKYYTIKDSVLTETTLTNFDMDGIELDVINSNISLLPNNFSLVSNEECKLSVMGLKKLSYMVVPKYALSINSIVYLSNIAVNFTNTKSSLKLVISVDDGKTYYTYKNDSFERVSITIPTVDYDNFTEIDNTNWENAKTIISENGIDVSTISSVDFSKFGALYGKDFKMKYALVVTVESFDSSISVNNIAVTYSSK